MNPRILFVINSLDELCPGQAFRELMDPLSRREVQVDVAVLDLRQKKREPSLKLPDIPFHFIGNRFAADIGAVIQLRQLAHRLGVDCVHSWTGSANSIARYASRFAPWRLLTTKLDLKNEFMLRVPIVHRLVAPQEQVVVSHTEIGKRLAQAGWERQQIRPIRFGAPLPQFTDISDEDQFGGELRETYSLPQDYFLIGAKSEMIPENRFKDLLWATDLVQCVRTDFRILIFGSGPQRWRLERFARQSRADQKAIFVDRDENFLRWLPELDLFWHAYAHVPMPFNVIAALRSGCPVLAPRGCGLDSLVVDDVNGMLFDEGQRDQIARRTHALFNDPKRLESLKQNAAQTSTAIDISETVDDLVELYQSPSI